MNSVLNAVALGIMAFIATNIDDLLILMVFFSISAIKTHDIVVGQYLGVSALIAVSAASYLTRTIIPIAWIGLMGVIPIAVGVKSLIAHENTVQTEEGIVATGKKLGVLTVTAITVSNGGDNIGVYIPLFASSTVEQLAIIIGVFLLMIGIWCAAAYYLVKNRFFGLTISKYGHHIFPFVLIGLGIYIFIRCNTISLLA